MGRMKHIDVKQLYCQEQVRAKKVCIRWVASEENLADVFTKVLRPSTFALQMARLGVRDEEPQQHLHQLNMLTTQTLLSG